MVYIQKTPVQPRGSTHLVVVSQLRLTLSSTSHKNFMKGANAMLEPIAQRAVQQWQRGFIEEHRMSASVAQVGAGVEEYFKDDDSEPAALCLDIAAAFPSIEWACVRWALRRLGVPASAVDSIFRQHL